MKDKTIAETELFQADSDAFDAILKDYNDDLQEGFKITDEDQLMDIWHFFVEALNYSRKD